MANETVKLSANLSRPVAEALKMLSEKRGVSMTEILRQAISHEKFLQDAKDRKEKILIKEPSGEIKEVVFG